MNKERENVIIYSISAVILMIFNFFIQSNFYISMITYIAHVIFSLIVIVQCGKLIKKKDKIFGYSIGLVFLIVFISNIVDFIIGFLSV